MCHHYSIDRTTTDAVDDEEETEDGRPPAFEDDRDVDVEILTDGGDE